MKIFLRMDGARGYRLVSKIAQPRYPFPARAATKGSGCQLRSSTDSPPPKILLCECSDSPRKKPPRYHFPARAATKGSGLNSGRQPTPPPPKILLWGML